VSSSRPDALITAFAWASRASITLRWARRLAAASRFAPVMTRSFQSLRAAAHPEAVTLSEGEAARAASALSSQRSAWAAVSSARGFNSGLPDSTLTIWPRCCWIICTACRVGTRAATPACSLRVWRTSLHRVAPREPPRPARAMSTQRMMMVNLPRKLRRLSSATAGARSVCMGYLLGWDGAGAGAVWASLGVGALSSHGPHRRSRLSARLPRRVVDR
jgi:hypothetical protein